MRKMVISEQFLQIKVSMSNSFSLIVASCGSRIFIKGMRNRRSGGQKSPSGVQGRSPGGGLGAKPPEARDIMLNLQLITSENFNIKK